MHSVFLRKFVGEFRVESKKVCGDSALTVAGVQISALVNEGRAVMSHFFANNPDIALPPIRMQGMLTYNERYQRFESVWMGSNVDGISYFYGRIEDDNLVFHQRTDDEKGRVMTVKFIDDDHFSVSIDPSIGDPSVSSLSIFARQ